MVDIKKVPIYTQLDIIMSNLSRLLIWRQNQNSQFMSVSCSKMDRFIPTNILAKLYNTINNLVKPG